MGTRIRRQALSRGRPVRVLTAGSIAIALAACAGTGTTVPATSPSIPGSAVPDASRSPAPPSDLEGRLLFSRFTEATHTFNGMFTAGPDGSSEQAVPLPGPEGGGRWSQSGAEIAVMTIL